MRRALFVCLTFLCSVALWSQTSATSSVPISVRIPGSITLSARIVPVSIAVSRGAQEEFGVPITVSWNLDPREVPGFRVDAYFSNQQAALVETNSGVGISAGDLLARCGGDYLPFDSSGSVTLFRTAILSDSRRGQQQETLSLKVADRTLATLRDGTYQGVLTLEVRNY